MIESVSAEEVVKRAGSPVFAYSAEALSQRVQRFQKTFAPLQPQICYAVKACGNVHILRHLGAAGCWMDVVSGGELERTFLAGIPTERVVFAGVGKQEHEIRAALHGRHSLVWDALDGASKKMCAQRGPVHAFNVESEQELDVIATEAARLKVVARCHLRVNPDVDAKTHKYITTGTNRNKFGVSIDQAGRIFREWRGKKWIRLCGLHTHIGSMIESPKPYVRCVQEVMKAVGHIERQGTRIESLDLGGGFGIDYSSGQSVALEEHANALIPLLRERAEAGTRIAFEPGRWIVAEAGVLLVRVLYTKRTGRAHFAVVDAGMNALVRPALYGAFHFIWPARVQAGQGPRSLNEPEHVRGCTPQSVVGPICESGDFLALERKLPRLKRDDVLAVFHAGAYGMSMSSTYNDQPKPSEVLIRGKQIITIRTRDQVIDLMRGDLAASALM